MSKQTLYVTLPICTIIVVAGAWLVSAGPLTPPAGPVASTVRFGPRTEITTLPYTITAPGSYYLGQSLSYAGPGDGITVQAQDVDIDLNGFELVGAPGTSNGIATATFPGLLTIHDGQIRDWELDGISLSHYGSHHIYNVAVISNDGAGVRVDYSGLLRNVIAAWNGSYGIFVGNDSKVTNCIAEWNEDVGIAVGSHSHVSDSVATLNGTYGIYLSFHSVLIGSTAVQNDEHGVGMYSGCRVTDCTASANGWDVVIGSGFYILGENNHLEGCVATRNWEHGFVSAGTVTTNAVEACTASENGDSGVGDGFRYFQKVVGCVANNNPGDGISLIDGVCTASSAFQNANHGITALFSTVADCDANSNGADGIWADDSVVRNNSVALNTDDGIEVGVGCHVWGNKSAENQDDGIEVGGDGNNIEGNNLYNNLGDAIDTSAAGGNSILSNRERGNPGGYNLNLAADTYGRIFAGPGMVNTGVAADHFVNISY